MILHDMILHNFKLSLSNSGGILDNIGHCRRDDGEKCHNCHHRLKHLSGQGNYHTYLLMVFSFFYWKTNFYFCGVFFFIGKQTSFFCGVFFVIEEKTLCFFVWCFFYRITKFYFCGVSWRKKMNKPCLAKHEKHTFPKIDRFFTPPSPILPSFWEEKNCEFFSTVRWNQFCRKK